MPQGGSRQAPRRPQEGSRKAPGRLHEGSRKALDRLQESPRKASGRFQEGSRKVPDSRRHKYPSTRLLKKVCQPQTCKRLKFRCRPKEFQQAQGRARRKARKTRIPCSSLGESPPALLCVPGCPALPSGLSLGFSEVPQTS